MSTRRSEGINPLFEAYAIRQISTGKFLPMRWTSFNHGYSYDEPTFDFPRLFKSHRSAQAALSAWLRGVWKPKYEKTSSYDWHPDDQEIIGFYPVKKEGRIREDFELVKVTIGVDHQQ